MSLGTEDGVFLTTLNAIKTSNPSPELLARKLFRAQQFCKFLKDRVVIYGCEDLPLIRELKADSVDTMIEFLGVDVSLGIYLPQGPSYHKELHKQGIQLVQLPMSNFEWCAEVVRCLLLAILYKNRHCKVCFTDNGDGTVASMGLLLYLTFLGRSSPLNLSECLTIVREFYPSAIIPESMVHIFQAYPFRPHEEFEEEDQYHDLDDYDEVFEEKEEEEDVASEDGEGTEMSM